MEVSGQLHAPAALSPREIAPGTHWIGRWVGPRAGLDVVVKRKIPSPRRESNPRTSIVQLVAPRWWREKYQAPTETATLDHPTRSPELYNWTIPVQIGSCRTTIQHFSV